MSFLFPPLAPFRRAFTLTPTALTRHVSTRARNLANRHWELVRMNLPYPAAQYVVNHQVTKAAIAGHTGFTVTTNTLGISPSAPKHVYVRGVRIPQRPKPPESDECCMSGCAVCVYDLYLSSLDDYKQDLVAARARLRELSVPVGQWPEEMRKGEKEAPADDPLDSLHLDPSMKAFLILEKKLGQKK
ncbi:Oxidoreductase-like protein, amino-terminal protein [Ceratobasidium theobromae]|uniref:Oxidoreductase-like protein, amino-terminal protein n=1 Tax=Ceratobasidium theobromae TaxID=1582974 RepID=A0A5N5QD85_9AGAM|nr:Oxidoreductase-like protein, amino-terminal protein [Ceratobasidium theobromae]